MKYNKPFFAALLSLLLFAGCAKAEEAKTPAGKLLYAVVKELSDDQYKGRKSGTAENEQAAQYLAGVFKAAGLEPAVGNSFLVPFEVRGMKLYNVCGILEGKSDSIYAFGAHFDHIGFDRQGPDTVFNGADDNASGVAAMIGIAAYFRQHPPQKTVLIMAFNAEEMGLWGSEALVAQPEMQGLLQKTQVLFNMEMVGTVAASGRNSLYMTGDDQSNLYELLQANAKAGFKIVKDPYLAQGLFFRSDNVGFYRKGIVAHSFSTCDMERTNHYHQKNDELGIIDFANLEQMVHSFSATIAAMMQQPGLRFKNK
ncbi:MAG: M28 family peptidase [Sphingobacteriales bacterium]|nr:MAG: M28 family peptidase [Sphingobacteriales bacterium]